ncbi:hypothetical protein [Neisseria montereyensis]|uniref:WYL domain-containing protein n=1 Tax=Neisseria montereyensis TaxID=2973938 RepID=A0ABT2FB13_9NEIS|nr:hypothetical protein [Neisseria montereyensis]MCS4533312.1 hypothetical protein [Neisseria montereyensis]
MNNKENQDLKKTICLLIGYLQDRDYSIRKLSKILFSKEIFKTQSWNGLKDKIENLPNTDDDTFLIKIKNVLEKEYNRSLFFGKKTIVFYDLPDFTEDQFNELESRIINEINSNSEVEYSKYFPNLIPKNILEEQGTQLFLVNSDTLDGNKRFWICGKKSFRKRQEFILSDTPENVQEYFQRFDIGLHDEVIAIHQDYKQLVSYFTIDKEEKVLTLYSDATAITSQNDLDLLSDTLFKHITKLYTEIASAKKKNIGSAIKSLYDEPAGRVISFSHYTDSGSVKHEKLDRKNNGSDLRMEPYHTGGMEGIQSKTEFHAIEKKWPSDSGSDFFEPVAALSYKSFLESTQSKQRQRHSACYSVVIDDCETEDDLNHLVSKIYEYSCKN